MILATIQTLCTICQKLILICQAQQAELSGLGCNEKQLEQWSRETAHLKQMLHRITE